MSARHILFGALMAVSIGPVSACGAPDAPTVEIPPSLLAEKQAPSQAPASEEQAPPPRTTAEAPAGYVEMTYEGSFHDGKAFVLLLDWPRTRYFSFVTSLAQAQVVIYRAKRKVPPLPTEHDLFDALLEVTGSKLHRVQIDSLRPDDFYEGSVFVMRDTKTHRFDARSSDLVALAVGHEAPIYLASKLLDDGGVPVPAMKDISGDELVPTMSRSSRSRAAIEPVPASTDEASAPDGYVAVEYQTTVRVGRHRASVVVVDRPRTRYFSYDVNLEQAHVVVARQERRDRPLPTAHDLFDDLLAVTGAEVYNVQLEGDRGDERDGASVFVRHQDEVHRLEGRPSDVLAIAIDHRAPIHLSEKGLDLRGGPVPEGYEFPAQLQFR